MSHVLPVRLVFSYWSVICYTYHAGFWLQECHVLALDDSGAVCQQVVLQLSVTTTNFIIKVGGVFPLPLIVFCITARSIYGCCVGGGDDGGLGCCVGVGDEDGPVCCVGGDDDGGHGGYTKSRTQDSNRMHFRH